MKKICCIFLILSLILTVACNGNASKSGEGDSFIFDSKTEKFSHQVKTRLTELKIPGTPVTEGEQIFAIGGSYVPEPALHGHVGISGGPDGTFTHFMFENLGDYDAFTQTYKERLLENYKINGNSIRLTLKPDLKWSDGEPIDADDLLVNLYLTTDAPIMTKAVSITKIDNLTVEIELTVNSDIPIRQILGMRILYPKKYYSKWGNDRKLIFDNMRKLDADLINYVLTDDGNEKNMEIGPERAQYKPNVRTIPVSGVYTLRLADSSEAIFDKNPFYYGVDNIKIDTIKFIRELSQEATSIAISEDKYDLESHGLSTDFSLKTVQNKRDTIRTFLLPETLTGGMLFNLKKYPTDNRDVRRAISYIVDSELIAPLVTTGAPTTVDTYQTSMPSILRDMYLSKDDLAGLENFSVDHKKASDILENIGWKKVNGIWQDANGTVPDINVTTISSYVDWLLVGESIVGFLNEFGLKATLNSKEVGAYWAYADSGEANMSMTTLSWAYDFEPYSSFSGTLGNTLKWGFEPLKPGEKWVFTDEVTKERFEYHKMIDALYLTKDKDAKSRYTKEFATFYNHNVWTLPMYDGLRVIRVYAPKLSLVDGKSASLQRSFYYGVNIYVSCIRMIKDGEMYYVE